MPNKLSSKQGITLIEILIYAGLSVIVLLVISNMILMIFSFWQNNRAKKELYTHSSYLTARLRQDINNSYSVLVPDSSAYANELVLLSTAAGQIRYTSSGNQLLRNDEPLTTDFMIAVFNQPDYGFRKIGNSIDWEFVLTSLQLPLQGTYSSQLIKGTALLSR